MNYEIWVASNTSLTHVKGEDGLKTFCGLFCEYFPCGESRIGWSETEMKYYINNNMAESGPLRLCKKCLSVYLTKYQQ